MKNQKIQRHQRRAERVGEIAHPHASHIQNAGGDSGAGNGGAQIRLQHDQAQQNTGAAAGSSVLRQSSMVLARLSRK